MMRSQAGMAAAVRRQRAEVLDYCAALSPQQWETPSLAQGWRVHDVVAHLGSSSRILFTPKLVNMLRSSDLELDNEQMVDARREWPIDRVLAEFARWSRATAEVVVLAARTPAAKIKLPIGNLGTHPIALLPGVFVFDWYTHLHHDIVPVLGTPLPPIDADRLALILEWLLAGLEQMNRDRMHWMDRPVQLTLTGPAGGTWLITPAGKGLLRVTPGADATAVAQISGRSSDFPVWATTRVGWRDSDVTVSGDADYGAEFLDSVNLI